MNILFLSYWNASDPLTKATVVPHLQILSALEKVENIYWVNIEREETAFLELNIAKVNHIPYRSSSSNLGGLGQILDFIKAPRFLSEIVSKYSINYLIARGSPSGALAHKVHLNTGIRYMVESFEPHADYMRFSGTWFEWGLKYRFQKRWEEQQKKTSELICTVSKNYKKQLEQEGLLSDKIKVVPCEVNTNSIKFSTIKRLELRQNWGWQNCIVGIYVGKFGGLYEEDEAFDLFNKAFEIFGESFRLILLNAHSKAFIEQKLAQRDIDLDKVKHLLAPHNKISDYLSVSDFAFASIKSSVVSKFCSPVKIGEYWAVGLPIIISEGIGDDSEIIENEGIGAVYTTLTESKVRALRKIQSLLGQEGLSEKIKGLALKHRSFDAVNLVYASIVNE